MPRRRDYRKQAADGIAIVWSFTMKHCGDPREAYELLRGALAEERETAIDHLAHLLGEPRRKSLRRKLPRGLVKQVFERDAYRCCVCGDWLSLSVDHVVPVAKGGTDELSNLQTLCMPCNMRKGDSN